MEHTATSTSHAAIQPFSPAKINKAPRGNPQPKLRGFGNIETTLIVFAREPIVGKSKTRLVPALGVDGAAALADAFTRDAIAKARAMRPRRLVIAATGPGNPTESRYFRKLARESGATLVDQGAGDLGARMAPMLSRFGGRKGAILIGTDTPSLPRAMLAKSIRLLEVAPVVVAPSLDGGYYLVGVFGKLPPIFAHMRWGVDTVLSETIRRLKLQQIPYALGPWWYDVDRPEDLALLRLHLERQLPLRFARAMPLGGALPCPATRAMLRQFDSR